MFKRFLSGLTGMAIAFSMLGIVPVSAEDAETYSETQAEVVNNDYEVTGTNSLGDMLAEKLSAESVNEDDGEGRFAISDVTVNGKTATVEYGVVEACTLVVGIFDEDKTTMLGTGTLEIPEGNGKADVEINIDTMPKYFFVKAFLVDSLTYRPLREAFTSETYTKKMQDFLALTTDDFDSEKVLNLDDDKTNNFMVFKDEVIVLDDSDGELVNDEGTTVEEDEVSGEAKTYTFSNAGARMKSLKKGDIFTIGDIENIVIAKVGSISVNGDTVVITEDDIDMEDVFGHIRIDVNSNDYDVQVNNDDLVDGVTYLGKNVDIPVIPEEYDGTGKLWDFSTNNEMMSTSQKLNGAVSDNSTLNFSLDFDEDKKSNDSNDEIKLKVDGSIKGNVSVGINIGFSLNYSAFFHIDKFSFNQSCNITGGVTAKLHGVAKIPLKRWGTDILGIIKLKAVPCFYMEGNVSVSLNFSFNYSYTITYYDDTGWVDNEIPGNITCELKVAASIF